MKILILTQKVDEGDPVLGFMTGWIREFASKFETITVICLEKGRCHLPKNVNVLSLGKESSKVTSYKLQVIFSRFRYLLRFYRHIWNERRNYDSVFVHMNEEYVLFGKIVWKILGKRVYMWRNHYAGSWRTKLAVALSDKVFCTSKSSYTAKFKKTVLMPVGVNLEIFKPVPGISREPRSVVFLARMSQSKKPDVLVEALGELANKKEDFKAKFFGNPPIGQEEFYDKLKNLVTELKLSPSVSFVPGVANSDAPSIFSAFEIFVNLSPAGMYDKTIFEAAACGCLVLATSPDFAALVGDDRFYVTDTAPKALADKLAIILNLPEAEKESLRGKFKSIAAGQGLKNLSEKIFKEIKAK